MSHNNKYLDNEGIKKIFNIVKRVFAKKDGYYEGLGAGTSDSSKQLLSTTFVEDKVPYNFRTSGGSADIGDRENDKIVGGSIVWNQLVQNGNFADSSNWTANNGSFNVSGNIATFIASATNGSISQSINFIQGHKYYLTADVKLTTATTSVRFNTFMSEAPYDAVNIYTSSTTNWQNLSIIRTASTSAIYTIRIIDERSSDRDAIQIKNVMVIDLTQMFGSTIANYISGLSDNGGVTWFRNLFPKPYYTYNAGSLLSVKLTSHDMVGFNQWDGEWELGAYNISTGEKTTNSSRIRSKYPIPVLPNTTYYFKAPNDREILQFDGNGSFIYYDGSDSSNIAFTTKPNCHYITFSMYSAYGTTYNHDICINLSWSGYRNGEYEEYEKISYALDNTLELRGIPKLDVNNKLYFDGDVYASDGSVERKYIKNIIDGVNIKVDYKSSATTNNMYKLDILPNQIKLPTNSTQGNIICDNLVTYEYYNLRSAGVKGIAIHNVDGIYLAFGLDDNFDTIAKVNAWLQNNNLTIIYELATPIEEQATPFQNPQKVNDFGTEEYVVPTQLTDVEMPVGHETQYLNNLRDKLQRLPDMPENNGYYVVHYNNRQCEFTSLSTWLTSNGYAKQQDLSSGITDVAGLTYTLKKAYKFGNCVSLSINARNSTGNSIPASSTLFTLGSGLYNSNGGVVSRIDIGGTEARLVISSSGIVYSESAIANDTVIYIFITYAVA